MPGCPKISIVTPSYNQGNFFENAIHSVLTQDYPNIEYIIIDGGSSDCSIKILKKYTEQISYWVSEKDNGQAHALNKGFKIAKGEIIGWLNSDDVYMPGTFAKVANTFNENPEIDFIFSHCFVIDSYNNIIDMLRGHDPNIYSVVDMPNFIAQPTVFFKKNVFDITGFLNEEYKLVMDFDYWRRIYKNHKMMLVNDVFACFRVHDDSKTKKFLRRFKFESKKSFFENDGSILSPYYFETFIKPFLVHIFIYNPIMKLFFFRNVEKPEKIFSNFRLGIQ